MGKTRRNYPLSATVPSAILDIIDEIRDAELQAYIKRTKKETLSTSAVVTVILNMGLRNKQAVIDEIRKLP